MRATTNAHTSCKMDTDMDNATAPVQSATMRFSLAWDAEDVFNETHPDFVFRPTLELLLPVGFYDFAYLAEHLLAPRLAVRSFKPRRVLDHLRTMNNGDGASFSLEAMEYTVQVVVVDNGPHAGPNYAFNYQMGQAQQTPQEHGHGYGNYSTGAFGNAQHGRAVQVDSVEPTLKPWN